MCKGNWDTFNSFKLAKRSGDLETASLPFFTKQRVHNALQADIRSLSFSASASIFSNTLIPSASQIYRQMIIKQKKQENMRDINWILPASSFRSTWYTGFYGCSRAHRCERSELSNEIKTNCFQRQYDSILSSSFLKNFMTLYIELPRFCNLLAI